MKHYLYSLLFSTATLLAIQRTDGVTEEEYKKKAADFPAVCALIGEFRTKTTLSTATYIGEVNGIGYFISAAHSVADNLDFANVADKFINFSVSFDPDVTKKDAEKFPVKDVLFNPFYPFKDIDTNPKPDHDCLLLTVNMALLPEDLRTKLNANKAVIPNRLRPYGYQSGAGYEPVNVVGYGLSGLKQSESGTAGIKRAMDALYCLTREYYTLPLGSEDEAKKVFEQLKKEGKLPANYNVVPGYSTAKGDSGGPVFSAFSNELLGITATYESINKQCLAEVVPVEWEFIKVHMDENQTLRQPNVWDGGGGNDNSISQALNWGNNQYPVATATENGYTSPAAEIKSNVTVTVPQSVVIGSLTVDGGATIDTTGAVLHVEQLTTKNATIQSSAALAHLTSNLLVVDDGGQTHLKQGALLQEVRIQKGAELNADYNNCLVNLIGNGVLRLTDGVLKTYDLRFTNDDGLSYSSSILSNISSAGKIVGAGAIYTQKALSLTRAFLSLRDGEKLSFNKNVSFDNRSSLRLLFTNDYQPYLDIQGSAALNEMVAYVECSNDFSPDESKLYPVIKSSGFTNKSLSYYPSLSVFGDYKLQYLLNEDKDVFVKFIKQGGTQSAVDATAFNNTCYGEPPKSIVEEEEIFKT